MNLERYIVPEDMSILDTMKAINKGAKGNVFVCRDGKLLAVVTDGDIRRYIIGSGDLNESVGKIANYHPVFVTRNENVDVAALMRAEGITALPVIDSDGKLIDIIFPDKKRDESYPVLRVPVVIMAGGKGTRLKPYTQVLPKPLIPIGDRTITEHIMDRFERYGCTHFDMIVNYKKNFIKAYFHDQEKKREIDFIEEPEFLGTAGGLRLICEKYSDSFFVTNCDILIDTDYEELLKYHIEHQNLITLVCARKKMVIPYGTIRLSEENTVKDLEEKPEYEFLTNTGLYVVEPDFIRKIPENTFIHITDVIKQCLEQKLRVGAYVIDDSLWMDMGQMDELEKMRGRFEKAE